MTDERWQEIKEMVKKNFELLESKVSDLPEEQGGGTKEELIFNSHLGKTKLELIVKPLVLSKKTFFTKRPGSQTTVDYVTSETEKVRTLLAYEWDKINENWVRIDSANFGE